ncbi:hypothetical protein Goarm_018733 [Gossypium armourianum]|uniref:Uncharacterized protein n=1 Tax=Gossypium armourianum TaxID=34283 RepID=A0A7J9IIG3_9ROSI|nr:hypothetical protein [Gossypium armourianum]
MTQIKGFLVLLWIFILYFY